MKILPRVAIDFGSDYIRADSSIQKMSSLYCIPSALVRDVVSGDVVAIGDDAVDHDLSSGQELVRPCQNGVIVDYRGAVVLLQHVLKEILSWWHVFRPQVVVSESLQLRSAVSQALGEAVQTAGGGKVYLTPVPALAALGAGIDPTDTVGHFVLDVGGGTTEAGVITRGSAAVSDARAVGGHSLVSALVTYVQQKYKVEVADAVAEKMIAQIGTALRRDSSQKKDFYANDPETGEVRMLSISGNEIAAAIQDSLSEIVAVAADVIKRTPTTLLSDVAQNGIVITGGVARLPYLDTFIERELVLPVRVVESPELAVISGARQALGYISIYEQSVPQQRT